MASQIKSTSAKSNVTKSNSKKVTKKTPDNSQYQVQKFGPKALALINKYNLQTDETYKKIISSYERIDSLPKNDPRRPNLVELWEGEFNRLFKHFWENYSTNSKKTESGINGWKDRLDIKPVAMSPDEKRKDLLSRLSPGRSAAGNNLSKEEILSRAGYQSKVTNEQFNFTATPKTGQNMYEIENILSNQEEEKKGPESILSNGFTVNPEKQDSVELNKSFDEETEIMTSKAIPDPNLLDFINDNKIIDKEEKVEQSSETPTKKGFVANENMSRFEFNAANNISYVSEQDLESGNIYDDSTLTTDFFESNLNIGQKLSKDNKSASSTITQTVVREDAINPEKRNILSKEGFEVIEKDELPLSNVEIYQDDSQISSKPYHELRPVGNYEMNYDYTKRPSVADMLEANKREALALDEMTQKVELLRELRDMRRHRINMMKIERANSYIVARARRMQEQRELKRIKKREEVNLKALEKQERLRRLQERQKLIELMKERQMKRAEEKRVATVLRLERERRMEKDAKYRSEIAAIDAQIRHEQEMIKRTELKMKAYFTKVHDDKLFEESLSIAKQSNKKLQAVEQKQERIEKLEQDKRKERIERISRKFIKNIE